VTLAELLHELNHGRVRLGRGASGGLRVEGPQGSLTPEVLAALAEHRDTLVATLGPATASTALSASPAPADHAAGQAGHPQRRHEDGGAGHDDAGLDDAGADAPAPPAVGPSGAPGPDGTPFLRYGAPGWAATYNLVNTPEKFEAFLLRLGRQHRLAVDLETTGLDPRTAKIVGLAFCWSPGEAEYVALMAPEGESHLDSAEALKRLKPILEDPRVAKINQNIKFDLNVLRANGLFLAGVAGDSMLADYLLRAGAHDHGEDSLARRHLGYEMIPIADLIGKKGGKKRAQLTMDQVPVARVAIYAGEDADVAYRLCDMLEPKLQGQGLGTLYDRVEVPLVEVLADMEFNGIRLDVALLEQLSLEMGEPMRKLEIDIYSLAGCKFDIGSVQQLRQVLFKDLALPVQGQTRTREPSTDAETLEKLSDLGHELPGKILAFRRLQKLKNTYLEGLPALVNPKTGRLHTSFNQAVTATGRLSSSQPNLQNIPNRDEQGRQIRQAFLAQEGWQLVKADYSQIELRMLAHFCGDAELRRAYAEGRDIHALVASQVNKVPEDQVTRDMRTAAKTINFGVIYGMTAHGLGKKLKISEDEAAQFIDNYYRRYPQVSVYQDRLLRDCHRLGYVATILGRRRYIQGVRSESTYKDRNGPEREAVNTQIQGSAADLIKVAMVNVHRRMKRERSRARLLLQVHDELVFEAPPEEVRPLARLVAEEMEGALTVAVPLKADLASGPNWLDMEPILLS
jgi:DNA polymerase-1